MRTKIIVIESVSQYNLKELRDLGYKVQTEFYNEHRSKRDEPEKEIIGATYAGDISLSLHKQLSRMR